MHATGWRSNLQVGDQGCTLFGAQRAEGPGSNRDECRRELSELVRLGPIAEKPAQFDPQPFLARGLAVYRGPRVIWLRRPASGPVMLASGTTRMPACVLMTLGAAVSVTVIDCVPTVRSVAEK